MNDCYHSEVVIDDATNVMHQTVRQAASCPTLPTTLKHTAKVVVITGKIAVYVAQGLCNAVKLEIEKHTNSKIPPLSQLSDFALLKLQQLINQSPLGTEAAAKCAAAEHAPREVRDFADNAV